MDLRFTTKALASKTPQQPVPPEENHLHFFYTDTLITCSSSFEEISIYAKARKGEKVMLVRY